MPDLGWGNNLFGQDPFGRDSFGRIALVRNVPQVYFDFDEEEDLNLTRFLDSARKLLDASRKLVDEFPTLRDADKIQKKFLRFLANDYGWKLDEDDDETLHRSQILNIARLYLLKGQVKGYKIVGQFKGYAVEVTELWETTCGSFVLTDEPPCFTPLFDETPLDIVPLDSCPTDSFAFHSVTEMFNVPADVSVGVDEITLQPLSIMLFTHVVKNGKRLVPGADYAFVPGPPRKIKLAEKTKSGDKFEVEEILNITLHPAGNRCKSHSLRLKIFADFTRPFSTFVNLVRRLLGFKPIHVTFETLIVNLNLGTLSFKPSMTATGKISSEPHLEVKKYFDFSPLDEVPLDSGLTIGSS